MDFSLITHWIQKVKAYIKLDLQEDPVRPWSMIRHGIGVVVCNFLYDASIIDYFEMRYFERTHEEKKSLFTYNQSQRFINHVNGVENNVKFYQKTYMYQVLGQFTKREQLQLPAENYETFADFLQRHRTVLYKVSAYCGNGVELWSADDPDIRGLYERSLEQPAVLDEIVTQHPEVARLNPDSINTVKLYTFMIGEDCHFVAAEFRMGRSGSLVDNVEKGGLAANVDIKTGKIIGTAYDLQLNQYTNHPDTGIRIIGFELPHWEELLRFAEKCARACPLAYVEWDFAIRENDCLLIEANPNARNVGIQLGPLHFRRKQFEELERLYDQSVGGEG